MGEGMAWPGWGLGVPQHLLDQTALSLTGTSFISTLLEVMRNSV